MDATLAPGLMSPVLSSVGLETVIPVVTEAGAVDGKVEPS